MTDATIRPEDIRWRVSNTGCWEWTGSKPNNYGYGRVYVGARRYLAHRVMYERARGPIPAGLQIDHLCRNRICVNPDHMEVVTLAENVKRGAHPRPVVADRFAAKTECPLGHPYDDANTFMHRGKRSCRECRRRQMREWRARQATR